MISVKKKVAFGAGRRSGRRGAPVDAAVEHARPGRVPRITRLMALAIYFDQLLQEGRVADQSELARLMHVTQPRMTQIMNLLHLAPDIQEQLLNLPLVQSGKDPITEQDLRPITALRSWAAQQHAWWRYRQINP